jgi:hypothetical protein
MTITLMESSLIYAASDSLKYKVNWVNVSDETEWVYFGADAEVNKPLVVKNITDFFPDSSLFIAINRKESIMINRNDLAKSLDNILGLKDFFIWDSQFKKAIEFSHIGVMRLGYI